MASCKTTQPIIASVISKPFYWVTCQIYIYMMILSSLTKRLMRFSLSYNRFDVPDDDVYDDTE